MLSYFSEQLAQNASRGVVNKVSDVKLEQGDLAEAWREGDAEYATVAMRYSLVDRFIDRASGRLVDGSDAPRGGDRGMDLPPRSQWRLVAVGHPADPVSVGCGRKPGRFRRGRSRLRARPRAGHVCFAGANEATRFLIFVKAEARRAMVCRPEPKDALRPETADGSLVYVGADDGRGDRRRDPAADAARACPGESAPILPSIAISSPKSIETFARGAIASAEAEASRVEISRRLIASAERAEQEAAAPRPDAGTLCAFPARRVGCGADRLTGRRGGALSRARVSRVARTAARRSLCTRRRRRRLRRTCDAVGVGRARRSASCAESKRRTRLGGARPSLCAFATL